MESVGDDAVPQTFEESVSGWADALSFSQASRLLEPSSVPHWTLGQMDRSSSLTQALAMRWDDELLRSTNAALSGVPWPSTRDLASSSDGLVDTLDIGLDDSEDLHVDGAESPYSKRSRSLSSRPSQPAFDAKKVIVPSLWRAMWWFLGRNYGLAGMLLLLQSAMLFAPLLMVPTLMNYLQYGSAMVSEVKAFVISAMICGALVLFAFFRAQAVFLSSRLALHFVSALRGLVFAKSLRLKFKPWDSRFLPLFTHLRLPGHVQATLESTSAVAHFILLSLPLIELYLTRFHDLWVAPFMVVVCLIRVWSYVGFGTLAGLFVFAGILTLSQFLGLRASEEDDLHAQRIYARDAHLEELLTHFKHIKQQCTDDFFEERLKSHQLAATSPSLFFWSLSFSVSLITPVFASLAAIFVRSLIIGARLSLRDFILTHALFFLINYFASPYFGLLKHALKMRDIMDQTRLLLLEEETESFAYSNSILSCARYAVMTKYHKLDCPVPQRNINPRDESTDLEEDRFGGFFEPPADSSEAPISLPLMSSPSTSDLTSSTPGILSPSGSSSNLLAGSNSVATPKKKVRPYAPTVDVIRIPAQHHIKLTNASFEWDSSGATRRLKNLNLAVRRGQLVVVLGSTDSGKSSLLKALLGEMSLSSGDVKIEGSTSYAPQKPWTLNETLCFNITFYHEPANMDRYNHVLTMTGLEKDIRKLPHGDKTLLSEANFTPAQLSRISLARCLYRVVDVYLIDDLFSTFESIGAANRVLEQSMAAISGTRVLALSKYMPIIEKADLIVHMSDGEILHEGSYQELMAVEPDFFEALEISTKARQFMARKPLDVEVDALPPPPEHTPTQATLDPTEVLAETLGLDSAHLSGPSFEHNGPKFKTGLRYYLRRVKMSTTWVVLLALIAALVVELTRFIAGAVWFQLNNPTWPPADIPPESSGDSRSRQFVTVTVYTLLTSAFSGLLLVAFWFFSRGAMDASNKIWFALVDVVLHWPISMLHGQNGGHIARLLSYDAFRFQTLLPRHVHDVVKGLFWALAFVLISVAAAPISAISTLGALALSARTHHSFHRPLSRLGRHHVKAAVLLESCYESVLEGAVTVRAYEAEQRFTNAFYARQDESNVIKLSTLLLSQNLSLRVGFWAALLPGGLCFCSTILALMGLRTAALFGIAALFSFRVAESLPQLYQAFSLLVVLIQALFNIRAIISHSPSEDAWYDAKQDPRSVWPTKGTIEFAHITLRKKSNVVPAFKKNEKKELDLEVDAELDVELDDDAIDENSRLEHDEERGMHGNDQEEKGVTRQECSLWDVSMTIPGSSTVVFCGRSGSGKSSIIRALMRFDKPERHGVSVLSVGKVKVNVDDLDISKMGLHTLRKSISIISPSVQTMTIREFLGDSLAGGEEALWHALESVGLKDKIAFSRVKLELILRSSSYNHYDPQSVITSSGHSTGTVSASLNETFSMTELLLLSMARALCRKTKIVVFKEPKPHPEYDAEVVKQALLENFGSASQASSSSSKPSKSPCTLIIIANSASFIENADRVFVMEDAQVAQEGTPSELAASPSDSAYKRLFKALEGEHALEQFNKSEYGIASPSTPKRTPSHSRRILDAEPPAAPSTPTVDNLIDL